MQVVEALPEAVKDLPEKLRSRKYWERTFSPRNKTAAPVMAVLQEMPAFTNQAPKSNSRHAWAKVFARHMGLEQVPQTLREVDAVANFQPVERRRVTYWRDAYGKGERVQRVRPKESGGYIHNPHRGTATFQRFQGEATYPSFVWCDRHGPTEFPMPGKAGDNEKYIPRTPLAYCRWPWSWLEPEKGKFNWSLVDRTLKAAHDRGQTAQLRFQPYTVSVDTKKSPPRAQRFPAEVSVDVPDWYWDTGAAWIAQGPFGRNEPDSNDPQYLRHFGDFVRAFGARYDGHPDLESCDIAYAGFWGECGGNSSGETAEKLAEIYLESFRKTQLIGMLGTPGLRHALRIGAGTGCHVGWRADSFGDFHLGNSPDVPAELSWNHMYDAYVQGIHDCGAQEAWKTAPVVMESSATVAWWVMAGYDIDRIVEEGYKYHVSVFMPKSVFFPEKALAKLIEFDKQIGYRFAVRHILLPLEARPGAKISVEMFTDNVGCAPLYRPYKLALRFAQGRDARIVRFNEDIRTWLPGHNFFREEIVVPPELEGGEVQLALGVVDDTGTPRVGFAIEGETAGGWHPLTSLDVLK